MSNGHVIDDVTFKVMTFSKFCISHYYYYYYCYYYYYYCSVERETTPLLAENCSGFLV